VGSNKAVGKSAGWSPVQINLSRIRKVREKLEEAMEEVERLLEELEASRSVEPPPERGVKTQRQRSSRRRILSE
jgi:hypothetical protein